MPRDLEALARREQPSDYTPPDHWVTRSDGVWLYEGDKHVKTLTFDMLRSGLFEACARYYGEQVRRG